MFNSGAITVFSIISYFIKHQKVKISTKIARKPKKTKTRFQYFEDLMKAALQDVGQGTSISEGARKHSNHENRKRRSCEWSPPIC